MSDAHQLTAGVDHPLCSTRRPAPRRCGWAWRSASCSATSASRRDGAPLTQRFSDLLLLGSTTLCRTGRSTPRCSTAPTRSRTVRSVVGARYSPGPFRTRRRRPTADARAERAGRARLAVAALRPGRAAARAAPTAAAARGSLVQRRAASTTALRDSRITDSVVGVEYDAGCWIGRVVAERAVHRPQRGDHPAAAAAGARRAVAARLQPAAGLEGQYPRLPPAARRTPTAPAAPDAPSMTELPVLPRAAVAAAVLAAARRWPPAARRRRRAPARAPRTADYIVAVVNQELVTAGEVEQRIGRACARRRARNGSRLPPDDELRKQVLDALIDERVHDHLRARQRPARRRGRARPRGRQRRGAEPAHAAAAARAPARRGHRLRALPQQRARPDR